MTERRWRGALAALVTVRLAFPLAALAVSGHKLPALPRYTYGPLTGDATGYLATARELLSADRRLGPVLALLVLVVAAAAWLALRLWRRRPELRAWTVAGFAFVVFLALAAGIAKSGHSPSGAVGWPLLWSVPLLPFRLANRIGQDVSFGVGLTVSLVANAATVVATAYAGRSAARSARVGVLAAALFALWPVLPAALLGSRAWANGTWNVDTGLALYGEPVSTACVAIALALVLAPQPTQVRIVLSGIAFGYAVAVRPTNVVFVLVALAMLLASSALQDAVAVAVGALAVAPVVLAFLPKRTGYELSPVSDKHGALWSSHYVLRTFTESHMWRPLLLAILVPVAAVGLAAVRSRAVAVLLAGGVVANAAIYAFFRETADHPRYLFAGLPALLVLWAAGAALVVGRTAGEVRSS